MTEPYKDPDVLRGMYRGEGMTETEIGLKLDCAQPTVSRWMDIHGIERRSKSEAQKARSLRRKSTESEANEPDLSAAALLWRKSAPGAKRLREMYRYNGMRMHEIADEYGVETGTVVRWLDERRVEILGGVERRETEAARDALMVCAELGPRTTVYVKTGRGMPAVHLREHCSRLKQADTVVESQARAERGYLPVCSICRESRYGKDEQAVADGGEDA